MREPQDKWADFLLSALMFLSLLALGTLIVQKIVKEWVLADDVEEGP